MNQQKKEQPKLKLPPGAEQFFVPSALVLVGIIMWPEWIGIGALAVGAILGALTAYTFVKGKPKPNA